MLTKFNLWIPFLSHYFSAAKGSVLTCLPSSAYIIIDTNLYRKDGTRSPASENHIIVLLNTKQQKFTLKKRSIIIADGFLANIIFLVIVKWAIPSKIAWKGSRFNTLSKFLRKLQNLGTKFLETFSQNKRFIWNIVLDQIFDLPYP